MIKAIVFDFDGVIVNTYENHYQTYAKKYKDLDRETHKRLFEGNVLELRRSLVVKDEGLDITALLKEHLMEQDLDFTIADILKDLNKKYMLFIITSHSEPVINDFLRKEKIDSLFKQVLGRESAEKKEAKFLKVLDKYSLKKNEVVFVTDTLGDILEAKKAGIRTIAVDFGFHERWRLQNGKPFAIVSNFEELEKMISTL